MSFCDTLAIATGSACAEFVTLPVCTIKTQYQTNLLSPSLWYTTSTIYKQHGLYGFYNASAPAIVSQIVAISSKYYFYNYIKNYRQTPCNDIANNVGNGMMAGCLGSIISHPFDVAKIYKQNQYNFTKEFISNGPSFLYRGYGATLCKAVLLSGLLFPTYDFYRDKFDNTIVRSVATTLTITSIMQPIDYIKVRWISNQSLFLGFNPVNYYRGVHLNLMRTIPHFIITISIADYIKSYV